MNIKFHKYQGAGNDFIIIDNRHNLYDLPPKIVEHLCDRKFGIGADGLMLLENNPDYDFRMRYFNSDGKEASMCGNGGRCIVAFAHHLGIFSLSTRFIASDGEHEASVTPSGVRLKMCNVDHVQVADEFFFLNTGSPHYVRIVENAFRTDVFEEGRKIRYAQEFQPEGTNVNFITIMPQHILVSTYERGVEAETLACGTGCVASALSAGILNKDIQNTYHIKTKGGDLKVSFKRQAENRFTDIWLEGPAVFVFQGNIGI